MDYNNFEEHVHAIILERGKDYFHRGAVKEIERTPDGWKMTVTGQSDYQVVLNGANRLEEWFCECPHAHGPVCKHVAAALYTIRAQRYDAIEAQLDQMTPDQLRAFVRTQATLDLRVLDMLRLFLDAQGADEEE